LSGLLKHPPNAFAQWGIGTGDFEPYPDSNGLFDSKTDLIKAFRLCGGFNAKFRTFFFLALKVIQKMETVACNFFAMPSKFFLNRKTKKENKIETFETGY
jgi:hypothetical protein